MGGRKSSRLIHWKRDQVGEMIRLSAETPVSSSEILQVSDTNSPSAPSKAEEPAALTPADSSRIWQNSDPGPLAAPLTMPASPGGFIITDAAGVIEQADHPAAVLLRFARHRLAGKPLAGFFEPGERPRFSALVEGSRQQDQIFDWETKLLPREDLIVPVLVTVKRMVDSTEKPVKLQWLLRDITNRQGKPDDLQDQLKSYLQELNDLKARLEQEIKNRSQAERELRATQERLEIRVRERTAELAIANEMLQTELKERRRAEKQVARRAQELVALNAATAALLTTLELEPLLGQILDAASSAIPAGKKGTLHMIAHDTGQLEMRAAMGFTDNRIQKFGDFNTSSFLAKVVRERKPKLIPDTSVGISGAKDDTRSAIMAPLAIESRVVGVISLISGEPEAFTKDDLNLLESFAAMATTAMRNAMLHGEVQKLAVTDTLTNVYNRRGFFELARREIERARRFGRPVSAIMIDMDHFKEVNDTYGHANGDYVLRLIAERLKQSIREIDVLGRYGGDEFILLLPETDLFSANEVAERLRKAVYETPIIVDDNAITLSISLGVARLPAEKIDLEKLLNLADQAGYAAKASGGNRVELWPAGITDKD